MNKDAVLASVIGFAIGLVITAGVLLGPNAAKSVKDFFGSKLAALQNKPTETEQPQENNSQETANSLTIEEPKNEDVLEKDAVVVKGKTTAKDTVIVGGLEDEAVATAKEDGTFEVEISLKEGKNTISVVRLNSENTEKKEITVYSFP